MAPLSLLLAVSAVNRELEQDLAEFVVLVALGSIQMPVIVGCAYRVLILQITRTSATFSGGQCSYPVFLKNNSVVFTGPEYCGTGNTGLYEWTGAPGNYKTGDRLCNEWPGVSGEPCATIES